MPTPLTSIPERDYSKGGPKFTKTEREAVKDRVAFLDRMGYNQYQIAAQVGVSQPVVGNYLAQIRESYRKSQQRHRSELVEEKLAQYRELRQEAYEAWVRSQQCGNPDIKLNGDAAFLRVIQDTYKMECALLGLDEQPPGGDKPQVNVNLSLMSALEAARKDVAEVSQLQGPRMVEAEVEQAGTQEEDSDE
jgi:hypothetical protein